MRIMAGDEKAELCCELSTVLKYTINPPAGSIAAPNREKTRTRLRELRENGAAEDAHIHTKREQAPER